MIIFKTSSWDNAIQRFENWYIFISAILSQDLRTCTYLYLEYFEYIKGRVIHFVSKLFSISVHWEVARWSESFPGAAHSPCKYFSPFFIPNSYHCYPGREQNLHLWSYCCKQNYKTKNQFLIQGCTKEFWFRLMLKIIKLSS